MSENKDYEKLRELGNPRKPVGEAGKELLKEMNKNHKSLTEFAIGFLNFKAGCNLLDIGCGGGEALALAAKYNNGSLFGLDYSDTSLEVARELNKDLIDSDKLKLISADVLNIPFADSYIDKAISIETFYFWDKPLEALKEIKRVLKPRAHFVLALDQYNTGELTEDEKSVVEKYKLNIYTLDELQELFNQAGYQDIRIHTTKDKPWVVVDAQK